MRKIPKAFVLIFAIGLKLAFVSVPAFASTPSMTLPTISVSGTTITTTPAAWVGASSTTSIPNDGEFRDRLFACPLDIPEVLIPVTGHFSSGMCIWLSADNASTPSIPTDTRAAYGHIAQTLVDLTNFRLIYVSDAIVSSQFYHVAVWNGGSGSSPSTNSTGNQTPPSPKTPTVNEFSAGATFMSPGTNAIITGSRLNCTTSVSVNDKPTTFTYQTLASGQGQLSIAMPKDLAAGKHRLSMDSCGGSVVFDNMLTVSKAPVKLELNMASGIDRGMGLVQLRAFVRQHRADFNSIECVADASLSAQKRIATSLVESFCKRAMGLLASPKSHTTAMKSDNKADSILLTVTLSNK